jgi:hypothetical protein
VLVARFGLTSNAPDAGIIEAAGADAGKDEDEVNEQSVAAQKARNKAKRIDHANSHPPPPPSDGDDH